MISSEELKLLISGFLGVIAHTFFKYQSLKKDAAKANAPIKFFQWLGMDWVGVALAFTSVFIWYFTFKEVANKYKGIEEFKRLSFVAMGGMGSFVLQLYFSRAKEWLRGVVDRKTDIADNKNQPNEN